MEKLVHSRLVGGDGVLFVPIGANVGLLECLADDVSRSTCKVGELISSANAQNWILKSGPSRPIVATFRRTEDVFIELF